MQKVAALRRYLRGPVKSDRIDALTLAKMPFIDPEQLEEVYLPSAEIHALQRLTRQRKRLESDIAGRKVRIEMIIDGYLPGIRKAFASPWSTQVRAFLPYELRDIDGKSVDREAAKTLILTKYHVSEDIRRERRRRNSKIGKIGETATNRINEAAKAPQPV